MSGRRYRVVERFPWIEGGRPAPDEKRGYRRLTAEERVKWEGGKDVIYEPGDVVYIEDRDLKDIYPYLEAIDEADRLALEEIGMGEITPVADLDPGTVEFLTRDLEAKRGPVEIRRDYANLRDGTRMLLSTRVYPVKPLPGVVYDHNGLPDPRATALQRERWEKESKHRELESKLARIRGGGSLGGQRASETKRDNAARDNAALLTDVRAYRAKHPNHGGPTIAKALVAKHGRIRDHADPQSREKAIDALRKRIERLEKKSLDT